MERSISFSAEDIRNEKVVFRSVPAVGPKNGIIGQYERSLDDPKHNEQSGFWDMLEIASLQRSVRNNVARDPADSQSRPCPHLLQRKTDQSYLA